MALHPNNTTSFLIVREDVAECVDDLLNSFGHDLQSITITKAGKYEECFVLTATSASLDGTETQKSFDLRLDT